jgi:amino acid transporter
VSRNGGAEPGGTATVLNLSVPYGAPGPLLCADIETRAQPPASGLGIPQAISLVLGSIIGVGVFNLPASLAPYGPISLVALGLTTIGALALALLFASLASRMPADGGPYAYARAGFGNLVGFGSAWLYWLSAWGGNAAIATGWVTSGSSQHQLQRPESATLSGMCHARPSLARSLPPWSTCFR